MEFFNFTRVVINYLSLLESPKTSRTQHTATSYSHNNSHYVIMHDVLESEARKSSRLSSKAEKRTEGCAQREKKVDDVVEEQKKSAAADMKGWRSAAA